MRCDVVVLPLDGISSLYLQIGRIKFHIPNRYLHNRWRVAVCERALDSARISARLNSLQSRWGWRRVAAIQIRGGKLDAMAGLKKSGKEKD